MFPCCALIFSCIDPILKKSVQNIIFFCDQWRILDFSCSKKMPSTESSIEQLLNTSLLACSYDNTKQNGLWKFYTSDNHNMLSCNFCFHIFNTEQASLKDAVNHLRRFHFDKVDDNTIFENVQQFSVQNPSLADQIQAAPNYSAYCEMCKRSVQMLKHRKSACRMTPLITHTRRHLKNWPFQCSACPKKFYGSNDATRHCVTHTPPATPIKENDEVIERLVFDVAKRNFPANASEIDEYFEIKHRYRGNLPTQTLEEATATTMYFQNESGMSDSNTDFCDESQNMEQSFMTMPKSEKQDVNPSPSSSTTQNQEGSENNGEISDFTKQIQAELLEAMKKVSELTAKVNELENENNRLYALLGRAEADKARLNDTITRLSKQ